MSELFAMRLREERVRLEPRQRKFAEALGIRQSQLSEWESKLSSLKLEQLAKLAEAGVDVQYLVSGRRGGGLLPETESALLAAFRTLDDVAQAALLALLLTMTGGDRSPYEFYGGPAETKDQASRRIPRKVESPDPD